MKNNSLIQLEKQGQSVWLDYIRRDLVTSGELKRLIREDGVRGITTNPSIFEKAIVDSWDYDDDIHSMANTGMEIPVIYEALIRQDVQMAADEFREMYDETDGKDGYVSLEINPHLAHDTNGTITEAQRLWSDLQRPNILIKVPATVEGLPAITHLVSEGININVTLLFGLSRYRQVAEAFIKGIEARLSTGNTVNRVASVASFFLSRIDVLVDLLLTAIIEQDTADKVLAGQLRGKVAVASAQMAYRIFREIFYGKRFGKLMERGARPQSVLWASTSTKNPQYSDVKYIEAIIGPQTINTMPVETLTAFRDHGHGDVRNSLEHDIQLSAWVLERLAELGIDIEAVARQLEDDGIGNFCATFDNLMRALSWRASPYLPENA